MLEQSKRDGPLYYSQEVIEKGKRKLISKPIVLHILKFGPPTKVIIHLNASTKKVLLEVLKDDSLYPEYYLYSQTKFCKKLNLTEDDTIDDETYAYYYGIAQIKGDKTPYLLKDEPPITISDVPTFDTFQLPPVLSGYPYKQAFKYIPELTDLIGHLKATYTDRYKRPLNPTAIKHRKYFPMIIDNTTTKFKDLCNSNLPFPIVVILNNISANAQFGCIDLEPSHTDDDLELANSFDAYYVEDTPRGGKHYLIRVKPDEKSYKYRLTPNIEAQIQCQITIYGINGKILNPQPEITDLSQYKQVGHKTNPIVSIDDRPDGIKFAAEIEDNVNELIEANEKLGSTGAEQAKRAYIYDDDDSHADFTALARLYRLNIKPLKENFTDDELPWLLASYAARIIPPRAKHSDARNGVPYLVYLADKIIN